MIKRILIASAIIPSALTGSLHLVSHGFIAAENYAINKATTFYESQIEKVATDYGFKKVVPLKKLTRDEIIEREAKINKVPVSLAKAVMAQESRGYQYAESKAGAKGLMQIMPEHVKYCSLSHESQLYQEEENIICGLRLLGEAIKSQHGDIIMGLKEYNAGANRIDKTLENRKYPYEVLARLP